MLAIAVSEREVRYLSWESHGDEVRLLACQVIPWEQTVDGFHNIANVRELIKQITAQNAADGLPLLYLTIDASFCKYSVLEVDPAWDVGEQLDFILKCRFGSTPFYESFQYPVDLVRGLYLNIDFPVVLRRAISAALPTVGTQQQLLSIGVFSAMNYARQVVPGLERGRRMFWRVSEDGRDQFLEILEGQFQALHLLDRDGGQVHHITTTGRSKLRNPIATFVEQLAEGQDALFPEVENVFVYQGSGTQEFLERILEREQSSVSLLNPFWRWNWPEAPEADNRFNQSAFAELAHAVWAVKRV